MSRTGPIIRVTDVSKSFHNGKVEQRVLHGVSLEVAEGELLAVVGTSGSGKSTLLNIIGGLDTRFTGDVEVAGHHLSSLGDTALSRFRNQQMGFVFQQFNLLEHLSCAENVALPAVFSGQPRRDALQRARRVLARVGMEQRAAELPSSLSGGQKQRIAIARALFHDPPLVLCDEPTGNLDQRTGAQIIDLFRSLNTDDGRTLVIVTHEARVSDAAHRVVRLEDGRFVGQPDRAQQAEAAAMSRPLVQPG